MVCFAELGSDEHAGTGNQLQTRLGDRQNRDDMVEVHDGQRKHFFLAVLLLRHLQTITANDIPIFTLAESLCERLLLFELRAT